MPFLIEVGDESVNDWKLVAHGKLPVNLFSKDRSVVPENCPGTGLEPTGRLPPGFVHRGDRTMRCLFRTAGYLDSSRKPNLGRRQCVLFIDGFPDSVECVSDSLGKIPRSRPNSPKTRFFGAFVFLRKD